MATTEQHTISTGRVASIDVFRGLTILTMIFVNDVAGVRGIPWWLEHFPPEASGMTFVDLVFPAFLFIVGMSIPFAMRKRKEKGDSDARLWMHIMARTAGLLTLGVFMVNMHGFSEELTGMSRGVWELLVFAAAIMVWNVYPAKTRAQVVRARVLRMIGIAALLVLAALYRSKGAAGAAEWMHTSWWGILGLIGWAYLAASLVYYFFGREPVAMMGMLAFFIALFVGDAAHAFDHPLYYIKQVLAVGPHVGGHAMIATSGMIVSSLFLGINKERTPFSRITWIVLFGSMMMIAGYCFVPLYGISKNAATPAWCLYSAAYCCWIFALLYWVVDVKGWSKWAGFLRPAGENPLLAYILPDILYVVLSLLGIRVLSEVFGQGGLGIARSIVIALAMVWLTRAFNKAGVRLHL